ncbi:hypothetical protein [Flavobacterium polysaccharolyticum]|uniref:Lipocalin-like domain-containing protein n=1 Tax=Flavobacterium polysaccharolyticum TaxID=3133148 RepID=A0ABU9NVQ8_9FLAO
MATKSSIILILTCLFFISCLNEKQTNLTGYFNGKYWDVISIDGHKYDKPRYSSFFGKNGDYFYYVYNYDEKENKKARSKFDYGDVIYPEMWHFENDSVVNIQSFRYRILKLTKTNFKIQNIEVSSDVTEYQLSPLQ